MRTTITLETPIAETPRVLQVRGMFDLEPASNQRLTWDVHLPLEERAWHIGLIVGPSGCGKSTIARSLWPEALVRTETLHWPAGQSVLDAFPEGMPISEVTALLSCVGFSSPPAWLRPFAVLSSGQKFRVLLARLLAESPGLVVLDEFTSVVDRTVAQIGSAALAKTVRRRQTQFVAVTCHEDVEPWLDPDWVYRPAEKRFTWRCLRRRPAIVLDIVRCQASAWPLFAPHHYLSAGLAPSVVCFLASWREQPVAFSAWLPFVGGGPRSRREHRTVTLPDYQGVGIGKTLSAFVASLWKGLGYRALSTTTHPALIRARCRSPLWRMHRPPSFANSRGGRLSHAVTRLTAGFAYVGPALPRPLARVMLARGKCSHGLSDA
jgi:energy-coupling factor transporter ATP-binding protein EcfA2